MGSTCSSLLSAPQYSYEDRTRDLPAPLSSLPLWSSLLPQGHEFDPCWSSDWSLSPQPTVIRILPPYLPTFLPSYLPNSTPSYLPTSLPPYLRTSVPPYLPTSLPPHLPTSLRHCTKEFLRRGLAAEVTEAAEVGRGHHAVRCRQQQRGRAAEQWGHRREQRTKAEAG